MTRSPASASAARAGRREAGYTVLEVMISMVIFAVAIMAIYSLQVLTISNLAEARELTEATNLAARIVEQFRRDSTTWELGGQPPHLPAVDPGTWAVLYAQPVNKDGLFAGQIPNTSPAYPPRYCIKYRMGELGSIDGGTYRIEVRVMWPRREGVMQDTFGKCPEDMDSTQNIPNARQVTLASAIYRH